MHFSASVLATVALFTSSVLAGPVPRNDPKETDFRTFGASGCSADNQGVYTLTLSDAGQCKQFAEPIGSLVASDNKCTLTLFADAACSESPVVVPTLICQNGGWKSYKLTC